MVEYNGINHLAMVTRDMDMTVRYYRDLLGMRLVAGLGDNRFRHYFFEISDTDLIAFFEWPEVRNIPVKDHGVPVKGPAAFDHLSIGVSRFEDLVALKKRLTAAGFWVSEIIDHGFIQSIYSFDPNNIPIEFSWPVDAVDIRKRPQMRDRHPAKTAGEGPDPQAGHWKEPGDGVSDEEDFSVYPGEGRVFRRT